MWNQSMLWQSQRFTQSMCWAATLATVSLQSHEGGLHHLSAAHLFPLEKAQAVQMVAATPV